MNHPITATAAPIQDQEHDRPDQQKNPAPTLPAVLPPQLPPQPGKQEDKDKQAPPQRREGVVSDPDAS